jgi:hypothetical protein
MANRVPGEIQVNNIFGKKRKITVYLGEKLKLCSEEL